MGEPHNSKLLKSLSKWANTAHQDAADMRRTYSDDSCVSIAEAPDRERVRLRGTLRTVTLSPRGGAPALEAELYDGTATAYVVWLGRRRIEGIKAGAAMVVEGRLSVTNGRRTIYNPAYELLPQRSGD